MVYKNWRTSSLKIVVHDGTGQNLVRQVQIEKLKPRIVKKWHVHNHSGTVELGKQIYYQGRILPYER